MPTTYFHRHSIRLRGYDYHQAGAYFITLAAVHHEEVFGFRNEEQVNLNDFGKVIAFSWQELPRHFPLSLDEWIVMPDHLHAIVFLETRAGENDPLISGLGAGTQADSLGAVIQNYKAITTRKINRMRHTPGLPIWQRNYYEHIIRSDRELDHIRRYIAENPLRHALRETDDYDV